MPAARSRAAPIQASKAHYSPHGHLLGVAEHAGANPVDPIVVALEQSGERLLVALGRPAGQRTVRWVTHANASSAAARRMVHTTHATAESLIRGRDGRCPNRSVRTPRPGVGPAAPPGALGRWSSSMRRPPIDPRIAARRAPYRSSSCPDLRIRRGGESRGDGTGRSIGPPVGGGPAGRAGRRQLASCGGGRGTPAPWRNMLRVRIAATSSVRSSRRDTLSSHRLPRRERPIPVRGQTDEGPHDAIASDWPGGLTSGI